MDERAAELRRDIGHQRQEIGQTVDEIENRVHPGHVMVRTRYRVRRRMADWKDMIMGSEEAYYPYGGRPDSEGGAMKEVERKASEISDAVAHTPETMRRQTRGNPLAAGLIAFGSGALIATLLPPTEEERKAAEKVRPQVESAAAEMADTGRHVAEQMKEPAREAAEEVKHSAE